MPILWKDIEELVVNPVRTAFQKNPKKYSQDFGRSYKEFLFITSKNPDWDLNLIGDAYCLRYHMQRMDNVYLALDRVHRKYPQLLLRSPQAKILDMGGGTAAATMAIAYWAYAKDDLQSTKISIELAEASFPMRGVAQNLAPKFLDMLSKDNSRRAIECPLPFIDKDVKGYASSFRDEHIEHFDLILFSFVLWIQSKEQWTSTANDILDIANMLKPNGVLLFLSPDKTVKKAEAGEEASETGKDGMNLMEKAETMKALTKLLQNKGFVQLDIDIPRGSASRVAPDSNPQSLREMLSEIAQKYHESTKQHLTIKYPFNPDTDGPYYSFDATVAAFTRP